MDVTVLGSCGAYPGAGRAASGYLLEHDGFRLVLDFGTAALPNLQKHAGIHAVDAVVISHSHADHWVDLYPLFIARFFHAHPIDPLPLFAAPRVFDHLSALEDDEGVEQLNRIYQLTEVEPGQGFEVGPFRFTTRPMRHPVPTLGMRIESDGVVLAYSADTGPADELVEVARGADVLVAEASWLDGQDRIPDLHLTARQAGEHAARAGAGRLVLSHFWPTNAREPSLEQAAETFHGEVLLADEDLRFEVEA